MSRIVKLATAVTFLVLACILPVEAATTLPICSCSWCPQSPNAPCAQAPWGANTTCGEYCP